MSAGVSDEVKEDVGKWEGHAVASMDAHIVTKNVVNRGLKGYPSVLRVGVIVYKRTRNCK